MFVKKKLREKILEERRNFDAYAYVAQNEKIFQKVKLIVDSLCSNAETRYNNSNTNYDTEDVFFTKNILGKKTILGLYMPLKGEPDLTKLAIAGPWKVALPKIIDNENKIMDFRHYSFTTRLTRNKTFSSILESDSDISIIPDIVIIPALAYDLQGYRIGFGLGCYDRYINSNNVTTIGVCFDQYLQERIEHNAQDLKVNYLVTENIIITL